MRECDNTLYAGDHVPGLTRSTSYDYIYSNKDLGGCYIIRIARGIITCLLADSRS